MFDRLIEERFPEKYGANINY
ncbi:hypothetical protein [Candidatus Nanopusillus massiliensis]